MSSPSIRRSLIVVALLASLLAMATPSWAPPKSGPRLHFLQEPPDALAGQVFSSAVVVVVLDSKGQVKTSSSALVTVALQGAGTLFGTRTVAAVRGLATFPDLMVDPAGSYTLVATDGNNVAPGISRTFAVTGFAVDCGSDGCSQSTGNIGNPTPEDPTIGVVTLETGTCSDETCFLTVTEDNGCPPGETCRGNAILFIPPANATGITVVEIGCDKTICPGTGVANFHVFKQRANGTWVELFDCPNPEPAVGDLGPDGCIRSRSRTGVGDLLIAVWMPADGDPRIVN